MSSQEQSPLIQQSSEQYQALEMDQLPPDLQRDSRYFYYLSVYPGLKQMEYLDENTWPQLPDEVRSAYVHTPYCTGVCSFAAIS